MIKSKSDLLNLRKLHCIELNVITVSPFQLNLTKIQSLPVIETPGKYAFFVDVTFEDFSNYTKAKKLIAIMASKFKILGEYNQYQR